MKNAFLWKLSSDQIQHPNWPINLNPRLNDPESRKIRDGQFAEANAYILASPSRTPSITKISHLQAPHTSNWTSITPSIHSKQPNQVQLWRLWRWTTTSFYFHRFATLLRYREVFFTFRTFFLRCGLIFFFSFSFCCYFHDCNQSAWWICCAL